MYNNENPTGLPKDLSLLRLRFLEDTDRIHPRTHLVVAVKLPTGAIEIITNTEEIRSKVEYYISAYDDNFCLKNNPAIQIVGYMLV